MTDINDVFGTEVEETPEFTSEIKSLTPFDFVNAISHTKENLLEEEWAETQYNTYVVNKALSFGQDTVIWANEMNSRPHIDKHLQFQFLINIIKPKKRYNKWIKADKIENLDVVKAYYNYNTEKARQALNILSDQQIDLLKLKLHKGGLNAG
jgi:hypothetical protein